MHGSILHRTYPINVYTHLYSQCMHIKTQSPSLVYCSTGKGTFIFADCPLPKYADSEQKKMDDQGRQSSDESFFRVMLARFWG